MEGEEAEVWFGDANGGNVSAGLLPDEVRMTRYKYASIYRECLERWKSAAQCGANMHPFTEILKSMCIHLQLCEFDIYIFRHVRELFFGACVSLTVAYPVLLLELFREIS